MEKCGVIDDVGVMFISGGPTIDLIDGIQSNSIWMKGLYGLSAYDGYKTINEDYQKTK